MRWVVLLLCAAVSPVLWVLAACVPPPPPPPCGNGIRVAAPSPDREGCDDRNVINGDTCSSTCEPVPYLVDGNLDDFEWFAYPEPHGTAMGSDSSGRALVVWTREYPTCLELRGRLVSFYGVPLNIAVDASHAAPCVAGPSDGSFVIATSTVAGLEPAVVGLASGWAVAYSQSRLGTLDIATRLVNISGKLGFRWIANHTDGGPLIPGDQTAPKLVANADGYVVSWVDENVGNGAPEQIWGRRYGDGSSSGQNQPDGNPFVIAGDPDASMSQVTLSGNGTLWAAAWLHDGQAQEVHLRRYTGMTPTDVQPIVVAANATTPELAMLLDGSVMLGYTTTYPFDGHVVRLGPGTSAVEPVISFTDAGDPSESILSLTRMNGYLGVAYVQDHTPRLEALSTTTPFDAVTTPLEWPQISAELAASFDTNVRLHLGTRGLWVAWSGVGAGTLNLGFSIFLLAPEFGL